LQEAFLANMSHELRTPVTALKGFTDLLIDWVREDRLASRYDEALEIMARNETFLLEIINSILDFSKLASGIPIPATREVVEIESLLREIVSLFRNEAEKKNLSLNLEITDGLPSSLFLNVQTLRRVLINLIMNGIKFTTSGGITIQVNFHEEPGAETGRLQVEVIDTGIGIEAKEIGNIFKPFYQVQSDSNRAFGGTGLGLSICQLLIEREGGRIDAQSGVGGGSRFVFTLPAQRKEISEVQSNRSSSFEPVIPAIHRKILVAEDSPDSRLVIQAFLKQFPFEIELVENGRDAVKSVLEAEKTSEPFDGVLMDMQMPVMSGYQAVKLLRQHGFKKPVIAVTAHSLQGDREKTLVAGCSDYISKPLDPKVFKSLMQNRFLSGSA
jgi:CheY-like chemotaxis protein